MIPAPLVLDYEWPAAASLAQVAVPGLSCSRRSLPPRSGAWCAASPAAFAGAWFFLILAPTSSVIPIVTEVAAEHRMYLPVAGVIALVVLGLFEAGAVAIRRRSARVLAGAGLVAAAAVVILFARMTHARNADYQDYDRIWSDTIAERPRNARARNNYATSLLMKGRYAEAEPHLRVAVDGEPVLRRGRSQSRRDPVRAGPARRRRRAPAARHRPSARLRERAPQSRRDLRDAGPFGRGARQYTKALEIAKAKGDAEMSRQLEQRLTLVASELKLRER